MTNKQQHWIEAKQDLINAANEVGIDVGVMVKISGFESSFNSEARPIHSNHAKNTVRQFDGVMAMSSAYGYGQFIDSTWQQMINTYGEKHGIEGASHFNREQANALRADSKIQAVMLAEFTKENIQKGQRLGGADADANVYAFHNLGGGDATKLLNALKINPNQSVNSVLSHQVIDVNHSLYGNGTISVAQAYKNMGNVMRQNEQFAIDAQASSDLQYKGSPDKYTPPQSSNTTIDTHSPLSKTHRSLITDSEKHVHNLYKEYGLTVDKGTHNTVMCVAVAAAEQGMCRIDRSAVKDGNINVAQMDGAVATVASVNGNVAANTPAEQSLSKLASIEQSQTQAMNNPTQAIEQPKQSRSME